MRFVIPALAALTLAACIPPNMPIEERVAQDLRPYGFEVDPASLSNARAVELTQTLDRARRQPREQTRREIEVILGR